MSKDILTHRFAVQRLVNFSDPVETYDLFKTRDEALKYIDEHPEIKEIEQGEAIIITEFVTLSLII